MNAPINQIEWGNGFAAVHGGLTVLMADDSTELRDDVWIAVRSGGIDQVLDALISDGLPRSTSFVVAHEEDDGLRLFLRGDAVVSVRTDQGDEEFDAAGMRTWSERLIVGWEGYTASIEPPPADVRPASLIESGMVSASSCAKKSTRCGGTRDPALNPTLVHGVSIPRETIDDQSSAEPDSRVLPSGREEFDAANTSTGDSAETDTGPAGPVGHSDLGGGDLSSTYRPAAVSSAVEEPNIEDSTRESGVADSEGKAPTGEGQADDQPHLTGDSSYSEMFGATRHRSVLGAAISDPEAPVGTMITDVPTPDSPALGSNRSESTWLNRNFDDGPEATASVPNQTGEGDHDGHTLSIDEVRRLRGADPDRATPPASSGDSGAAVVQALVCPDGHPNPPYDAVCRVCGVALTGSPCVMNRPPLGRLRFSTGDEVVLDRPLLVGRKPDPKGRRFSDIPRLLQLDVGDGLSRSHALVLLEGWQVRIEDLGSTNDTTVTLPGREPQRLRSGEPVLIVDGTSIDLGGEVECVFDAHT